jgi:hypothetical protein
MAPILHHKQTLLYYDGPQVVLARDQGDTEYVCTLVVQEREADKYLCVAVSASRLQALLSGAIDLLGIYRAPRAGELLVAVAKRGALTAMPATPLAMRDLEPEWLPEAGLFLQPMDGPSVRGQVAARRPTMPETPVTSQQGRMPAISDVSRMSRSEPPAH